MSRVMGNSGILLTNCERLCAEQTRKESNSIQREIDGLVALEYQMGRNAEELKRIRAEHDYSLSGQGRIIHIIGLVFSVYCVFRTASVSSSILVVFKISC